MSLSEHQLNNIIIRTKKDVSLVPTSNKTKYEISKLEQFMDEFICLDTEELSEFIKEIYNQQFNALEQACIDNFDYISLTGLGNLKTNYARQEILKLVDDGGTTYKEDIQHIMDEYIRQKQCANTIPKVNIKLQFDEINSTT